MSHTPTTWKIVYENEVGPDDEGFWEWWEVTNGMTTYKCESEEDAVFLLDKINNHDRLTAEVGMLKNLLSRCAEWIEELDNQPEELTKELLAECAKALNPEEPK